jgi:exosortase
MPWLDRPGVCFLFPLVLLWWRLIQHLRVEWAVNPQYAYGWAVPFLCVYLIWDRSKQPSGQVVGHLAVPANSFNGCFASWVKHPVFVFGGWIFLVLTYLPVRLIQEANPEWRLVSWALAFVTVGTTAIGAGAIPSIVSSTINPGSNFRSSDSIIVRRSLHPLLPIWFFLVAVPWPTFLERAVIQGLTRTNVAITVELLSLLGIPALRHGNVIEVGSGAVEIDAACSGIRSFQACFMLALFLALFYRLTVRRGLVLWLLGIGFSFVFNLARTALLAWVAAKKGPGEITSWHDPAGLVTLLACFLSLWALAVRWRLAENRTPSAETKTESESSAIPPISSLLSTVQSPFFSLLLIVWILLVEVSVEGWYRWHERRLGPPVIWQVELPRESGSFRELPFSEKARQFLRFDEGVNADWTAADGTHWQAIFLSWKPGRIGVRLARSHAPEVCLSAAGHELVSRPEQRVLRVKGLDFPYRYYVAKSPRGSLKVFYFLWEDRARSQNPEFGAGPLSYANRFASVLSGERNLGQRSLELAVWGIEDLAEIETTVASLMEKMVKVEKRGG